jgi:hypothetical protein
LAIARPARNEHNPLFQQEMDDDPLTYTGNVRAKTAVEFIRVTANFLNGGLRKLQLPFVTFHAPKDTFTDPYGSERLISDACSTDKTYLSVGQGLDVDVDMWHALGAEPGFEVVAARAIDWINKRLGRPAATAAAAAISPASLELES